MLDVYTPRGYHAHMNKITNRLRRLRGQLESLETAISAEAACSEVVPQFLAIKGAVDASLRVYIEDALEHCATEHNAAEAKQIIKTLIKHA